METKVVDYGENSKKLTTVTIVIRTDQLEIIKKAVEIERVTNRSEFFRALIDHYAMDFIQLSQRFNAMIEVLEL